jgi:hypothetical protein
MERLFFLMMAGSIVLALGVQDRAIAQPLNKPSAEALRYLDNEIMKVERMRFAPLKGAELQNLRNYRKVWAKQEPQMAPFLGEWTDAIEGSFGIYPSSTAGEVCILAPFSGYVTNGKILGNTLHYAGRTGKNISDGTRKNILYELGRETVIGARFAENSNNQLIPFFAQLPLQAGSQRARIFEKAGCRITPPQVAVAGGRSNANSPGLASKEEEVIRKFNSELETYARSRTHQDNRNSEEKRKINSFKAEWSATSPDIAQFLGDWGGIEERKRIYPSRTKGKVCIIDTFLARKGLGYEFSLGEVRSNRIYTSNNVVLFLSKSSAGYILGTVFTRPDNGQLGSYGYANPRPLLSPDQSDPNASYSDNIYQLAPQFKANNCTTGLSEETSVAPPISLQPIAAASTYAYPSPSEFAQFKNTLKPSPIKLSTTDRKLRQDFQAEWQKKNRAIAPYVGAWKTADNQDIYVFPSTVSQRACVVRQKDGQLEMKLAISLTADMRFGGNTGMFKVDPMTDVVAGRSDKSDPLSALYGAIGSPNISQSIKDELVQARCMTELPQSK